MSQAGETETAVFGGGCYWCIEAVFQQLDGVDRVESGFMGGTVPNPSYREVCHGDTGHAEVVRITYDPGRITYDELLHTFWKAHDPTQVNRQGADVGEQYRSVIFYVTEAQRAAAEASKKALQESGIWSRPIATSIESARVFYPAPDDHQDYYRRNDRAPYCRFVIAPKLQKLGLAP